MVCDLSFNIYTYVRTCYTYFFYISQLLKFWSSTITRSRMERGEWGREKEGMDERDVVCTVKMGGT